LNTEYIANLVQEFGKFSRKLSALLGSFGKIQQFLADQIIQRVSQAEAFFDAPRGLALRYPFLLELNL
jgi:hypothetical protein